MQNPDDILDDLDSDLDYDNWEDDGLLDEAHLDEAPIENGLNLDDGEDNNPSSSDMPPHKKSAKPALLLLLLLGSGGLGAYYYLSTQASQKTTPIVKLDTARLSDDENDGSPIMASDTDVDIDQAVISIDEDVPQNNVTQNQQPIDDSVLTPMPTAAEESNIVLAPLDMTDAIGMDIEAATSPDSSLTENIVISTPEIQEPNTDTEIPALSLQEQQLLSKTEETLSAFSASEPSENSIETNNIDTLKNDTSSLDLPAAQANPLPDSSEPEERVEKITKIKQETKKDQEINKAAKLTEKSATVTAPPVPDNKVPPPEPQWEIRGANPQAAVLYDKTSKETRTVEPGNTVKGLGRIKSIHKKDGKWVVAGTSGNVTQ